MKRKIGVLGSCASRDAFNSNIVKNYKDFFEMTISAQRTSLISIMQKPIVFDEHQIEILPLTRRNLDKSNFISYDLNRNFLKELLEKDVDYLVIDNFFEIHMGILYFNGFIITHNDWDLPHTEFYKKINKKLILTISKYPEEYFCIWSKYCDLFFEFLDLYCPNVKLILNKCRLVDEIKKSDETTYINQNFTQMRNRLNPFLDKLDSYIINNFDVYVFDFNYENVYADENHMWGIGPVHYTKNYYYSLIEYINNISHIKNKENEPKSYPTSEKKERFDNKLKRANFETKLILQSIKDKQDYSKLTFYNRARIDIKNHGSKTNKIKIIESDVNDLNIHFPNWFKNKDGEGAIIENEIGTIDLKIKCINDGNLKIYLRGPDIRDKNQVRFPIYIDFTKLIINEELIFNDNLLVSYIKPYIFNKDVKDCEILDVHIEWTAFNNFCEYVE